MGRMKPATSEEAIVDILNHPKVFRMISDDCTPVPYEPVMAENIIYLMDTGKTGVIRIDPMNGICCTAHIALLPKAWGKGIEFVTGAADWIYQNTKYMKAVTMIPVYNRLCIKLVKDCGFKQEGIIKKSFLKNWKLWNQEIWSLTKGDILCHQ